MRDRGLPKACQKQSDSDGLVNNQLDKRYYVGAVGVGKTSAVGRDPRGACRLAFV